MTNPQEVGSYDWGKSQPTISTRRPRANPELTFDRAASRPTPK
ncbi:MAG: hypothetical protein ABMA25_09210 [Ilumatobacteraceae bacterium]